MYPGRLVPCSVGTSVHVVLSCIFHCSSCGRIRRIRVHLLRCSASRSLRPGPRRLLSGPASKARSAGRVRGRRDRELVPVGGVPGGAHIAVPRAGEEFLPRLHDDPGSRPAGELRRHLPQVGRRRSAQDLAASESTSVGRRGLPARASASSSLTAASRCPP